MRTICPRCGVISQKDADFCFSCGHSLKSAVSSIPPVRTNRAPASEVNVDNVVTNVSDNEKGWGDKSSVSVRYKAVAVPYRPSEDANAPRGAQVDDLRKTVMLHSPASTPPAQAPSSDMDVSLPRSDISMGKPAVAKQVKDTDVLAIQPLTQDRFLDDPERQIFKKRNVSPDDMPSLGIQRIWYKITQHEALSTVAFVPANDNIEVLSIAHGMGKMAVREPCDFVRVVNAALGGLGTSKKDSDAVDDKDVDALPYEYFDLVRQLGDSANSLSVTQLTKRILDKFKKAKSEGKFDDGKIFIAVDSVLSHPDAIAVCRAVDKVILCVELGFTRFDALKQILEAVGKEKVLGYVAINPAKKAKANRLK
ncbi:MAG: hypothetical protein JXX14_16375 [Deltaproteobacteria bacterium]|nr:hypothetical protein [Deltaproteobacteria bacterium]